MIISALGIAALAALLGWILGGIVLRLGGLLIAVAGLAGLAISGDVAGVLAFVIGAVFWLAGQWHYALRHQAYKSPLARHLFVPLASGASGSDPPMDPGRRSMSGPRASRGDRR